MKISKLKIVWKWLTGGKEAVLDYVLDIANNLVGKVSNAKQEEMKGYLSSANAILDTLRKYKWICPAKWQTAYGLTLQAFAGVVNALYDLKVTSDELAGCVTSFQVAYAAWRTDDDDACDTAGECASGECEAR